MQALPGVPYYAGYRARHSYAGHCGDTVKSMTRVTISVPSELLEAVDQKLAQGDESRSAVVRRLIEAALRELEEQDEAQRYIRAYQEQPQTEEEFGWSDQVTLEHLAELPWK